MRGVTVEILITLSVCGRVITRIDTNTVEMFTVFETVPISVPYYPNLTKYSLKVSECLISFNKESLRLVPGRTELS